MQIQTLYAFLVIVGMTVISKGLRSLAFGRADSIALDVSISAFFYCLIDSLLRSPTAEVFLHEELMRCIVLLLFAFIIAATHRHYKDMCMAKITSEVERLRSIRNHASGTPKSVQDAAMEKTVLDETELLARQAIEVWYSQFADRMFYRFLRGGDPGEARSFKKKKTLVRWSFANILNSLGIMDESDRKLNDQDFNIDNKSQIIGMLIFDSMMILSVLVAIRLI